LLWINILFLLWVALVPFSTALLSEYTKHPLAIAVYGGNMIAIGLTLALHWWYATARRRHVDPDVHPGLVRAAMSRVLRRQSFQVERAPSYIEDRFMSPKNIFSDNSTESMAESVLQVREIREYRPTICSNSLITKTSGENSRHFLESATVGSP
jgi:hypothetical protein